MGYGPKPEEAYSGKLLNLALDHGYTFLDTAAMYGMGHNESLIGKYLSHRRHEYTLASKCGIFRNAENHSVPDGRPETLQRTCEDSLKRLNTDVIDLYYLHRIDAKVPVEESVGALSRMVEDGKVRTIGLSEIASDSLRRAHAVHPITAVQSEYSLWSRTPERSMLTTCRELGVAFVPFAPLGRQFLTGKSGDVTTMPEGDVRTTMARPRFEPEVFAHNRKLLEPYTHIAHRVGCTLSQLALAWLLAQPDQLIPIPGTKHIDWMRENAGAGEIRLDPDTVASLNALINDQTVEGDRYVEHVMQTVDSERDIVMPISQP